MIKNWHSHSPKNGDWMKGKPIASGTFGTVHLAMNKTNGVIFVAKTAKSEYGLESLKNEATILENLDSPYIVKATGKTFINGENRECEFNLLMEYLPGGNLSDMAEKFGGTLDERVIRLYTREILLGLIYLHESGIVHGDLKCKNVLLDTFGRVKLADFGSAKKVGEYSMSSSNVIGTPLWMAPEVLRNGELEYATDIWSLGCTIIEMATGRPPWGNEVSNPTTTMMKIACSNDIPTFPRGFSKAGNDFLDKCLQRDPRRRWNAKELMNHPFVSGCEQGDRSPTSVFDIEIYEERYDSNEWLAGDDFNDRIRSLSKFCDIENDVSWSDNGSDNGWITVRSDM